MNVREAAIHAAIQALLDSHGDGYQLAEHVIVMGLERVDGDGIESTIWYWAPADQPLWKTGGLIEMGARMVEAADADDD